MASNDPNEQRNAENRRFVAEILRQTANQYGRPSQRVGNRVGSFLANTVMSSLGLRQTASNANVGQIPRVSTYDMQVDQLARGFRLPGAEDAIRQSGARAPRGMALSEATTRAFIKAGEESGLTLEEIRKLLQESRSEEEQTDASGNITLDRLTQEAHELYTRMAELFTVPDLSGRFNQIGTEQTRTARRERAREEYNNRPITQPDVNVFQPTPFMNKMLDAANRVFGGPQAKRRFEYTATNGLGNEVKGQRDATNRDELLEWLKIARLTPTNIEDIGASGKQGESSISRFMTSFADYMGVARMTKADQNLANEDLSAAIDKLIDAMNNNTDAKSGTKGNPAESPIKTWLKGHATAALEWIGPKAAKLSQPLVNVAKKFVPPKLMEETQRWGAHMVGSAAARMGVTPAVAARFGAALGAAAGVAGVLTLGFGIAVKTVSAVVSALNGLARQSLETTLRLATYSGILAAAKAQLEVGRIHRDLKSAQNLAPGGAARLESENRFEEALRPMQDALTDIGNAWGTIWKNTGASILEALNALSASIKAIDDKIPKPQTPLGGALLGGALFGLPGAALGAIIGQQQQNKNNPPPPKPGAAGWFGGPDPVDAADLLRRQQGPRPPGMAVK
jgi:DNA-binding transcriptional MerR regulator